MTELKTLKDFDGITCTCDSCNKSDRLLSEFKIKEEAVKWVKGVIKDPNFYFINMWIKHFFNLTEEDLE